VRARTGLLGTVAFLACRAPPSVQSAAMRHRRRAASGESRADRFRFVKFRFVKFRCVKFRCVKFRCVKFPA